jgi:uncharacterized Zn finger protein
LECYRPPGGLLERKAMNRVPDISEIDVQNWVGARSFQKGYRYFEDEAILNPRRRGRSLIAECQGTQAAPYRVELRLGLHGVVEGRCTCAAGEGGHCKHAAALLLTWLHEPEMFVEVPELEQMLENRSREDLIALIQQMISRHPDLEQLIELSTLSILPPGEPVPPERIAQQVHRAFSSAGGEMGGDNAQVAENLQPILDLAEELIDREDIENAATVYRTLIDSMLTYGLPLSRRGRRPGTGARRVRAGHGRVPAQYHRSYAARKAAARPVRSVLLGPPGGRAGLRG